MATEPQDPSKPHSNVKVYEQKPKSTPMWLWLLPLLALVGFGLWWVNRPHDNAVATAQTDNLKPDNTAAVPRTDVRADATAPTTWTTTGIANAFRGGGRVNLGDSEVHFATGSAQLQGDSQAVLDQVSQVMKDNPDWKLRVEGHTDSTGDAQANEKLAMDRAVSVAVYLSSHGVSNDRIHPIKELGQRSPTASNATDIGRAENRRVELIKE